MMKVLPSGVAAFLGAAEMLPAAICARLATRRPLPKTKLFVFLFSALAIGPAWAQSPRIPGNWTLTFNEDFNGSWLDGTRWRMGEHWAGMSGSGGLAPGNVTVSGGTLKLKTENASLTQFGVTKNYRSAEVSTFFQFRQQYGYFEARIKYPAVTGLWPAFWLMPDRASYGSRENYRQAYLRFDLTSSGITSVTGATLRLKTSGVQTPGTNHFMVMKLGNDTWTESTLTWNNKPTPNPVWLASHWNKVTAADQDIDTDVTGYLQQQFGSGDKKISFLLEFYVDGIRTASWSDSRVMSVPAYMILSLQLGGWDNNNPGPQIHNQVMEVDWVRAWSGTRSGLAGAVVDNLETDRVVPTGTWTNSSATAGYFGPNYVNDGNTGKGTKSFSFQPPISTSGNYQIYARWTSGTNRASNVPVDIVKSNGTVSTVTVNQQANGSQWNLLGTFALAPGNAEVRIRTTSTDGYVIADAVRVVPAP